MYGVGCGQRAAVSGIGEALEGVFVAVIDGGDARKRHLHERGEPETSLGQAHRILVEAEATALLLGQLALVGAAAEHGGNARLVVHERGEPETSLGQAHRILVEAEATALLLGQLALVGAAAEHGGNARLVVAAEQVEAAGQGLGRVILAQGLDSLGALVGVLPVNEKTQYGIAQRVVHGRVELVTQQVFAQLAVEARASGG